MGLSGERFQLRCLRAASACHGHFLIASAVFPLAAVDRRACSPSRPYRWVHWLVEDAPAFALETLVA